MTFLKRYWILIIAIILGTALRLYHGTAISLWHDEAFSAMLIKYPWREMMYRIGLDVHPPAYYVLLRLWHYMFGGALWSLRGFSILFGVLAIPMSYGVVKAAFKNERAALWAALLVALNPFQIQYGPEARMYTMGAFFVLAAAFCLAKALDADRDQYGPLGRIEPALGRYMLVWYGLFAVCTSVIMYTHYYLLFSAAALMGYGLVHHIYYYRSRLRRYIWLAASYLAIIIFYIPWLKTFLFQFHQVSTAYWITSMMDRWSIPGTLWQMILAIDFTSLRLAHLGFALVTIFIIYFLYRFMRRALAPHSWLILLSVIAPFAGSLLFALLVHLRGEAASVFLLRYFLFGAAFLTIALAVWLESMRLGKIGAIVLLIYAMVNIWAVAGYWNKLDVRHKPGMAAAAKYLQANVEPDDRLYIGSDFEFSNYKYYNKTQVRPLLYSKGAADVKEIPHYDGAAILTNDDLLPSFEAAQPGDTVWLLWTNGFDDAKPPVPANWTQIDEKGYPEVRPYVGTWVVVTEYKVN